MTTEDYIAARAEALAHLVFLRRDDVEITRAGPRTGLEYLVAVYRDDKPPVSFAMLVRGAIDATPLSEANQAVQPTVDRFRDGWKWTIPVCLVFFTMRDDNGYFSWLSEPVLTADGPKLVAHDDAAFVPFTNELRDEVVRRVVEWYEAAEAAVLA